MSSVEQGDSLGIEPDIIDVERHRARCDQAKLPASFVVPGVVGIEIRRDTCAHFFDAAAEVAERINRSVETTLVNFSFVTAIMSSRMVRSSFEGARPCSEV